MTSPHSPTLAEQLAASRAAGNSAASSAMRLCPEPPLPKWEELKLDGSIRLLYAALVLNLLGIYCIWRFMVNDAAFPLIAPRYIILALAIDFIVLIGMACRIQARLHQAGLQKIGWLPILILAVILNPLVLGWIVPALVLCGAEATRRRLKKAT
jgi:hypothetical protein